MGKKIDLTGQRFGRLVVVEDSGERSSHGNVIWDCLCDCGNTHKVRADSLVNKAIRSCGCLQKEIAAETGRRNDGKTIQEWAQIYDHKEGTKLSILTQKISKNTTSGVKGVSWDKRTRKWHAYLMLKEKRVYSRLFAHKQDAIDARKAAEEKYFKPILEKYGKDVE